MPLHQQSVSQIPFRERIKVRVIVSRVQRAHVACPVPRAAYFGAMWWKAGNASILVKLTFVDKPSTPRERARRLRREQTEAERFLWARSRARQLPQSQALFCHSPRASRRIPSPFFRARYLVLNRLDEPAVAGFERRVKDGRKRAGILREARVE